jgi:hypothetical protein
MLVPLVPRPFHHLSRVRFFGLYARVVDQPNVVPNFKGEEGPGLAAGFV